MPHNKHTRLTPPKITWKGLAAGKLVKTHKEGSPFFDLQIFKRRKDKEAFIRGLEVDGYVSVRTVKITDR